MDWRRSVYGLLTKLNATVILHEKTIEFHPSSETGVKGVFFYFVDCVVVWVCFNSSVNFGKHFCWLAIINKGCETNRKNVAETA